MKRPRAVRRGRAVQNRSPLRKGLSPRANPIIKIWASGTLNETTHSVSFPTNVDLRGIYPRGIPIPWAAFSCVDPCAIFDDYAIAMDASTLDDSQVLESARQRGFLSIDFVPTDEMWSIHSALYDGWRAWCEEYGRHPVMVFPGEYDGWSVVVGFEDGVDAESEYVRHEIREAFVRHGGGQPSPDHEDPRAWYGRVLTRAGAEAVAKTIVAIDSTERNPSMEVVFQFHAR